LGYFQLIKCSKTASTAIAVDPIAAVAAAKTIAETSLFMYFSTQ